jgi:hypothetical protein
LFIADIRAGTIGKYTTSGATVNASLISGLHSPRSVVVSGTDLFVVNGPHGVPGNGTIGQYTTSGVTVNASLISGLNSPEDIAIVPTCLAPVITGASASPDVLWPPNHKFVDVTIDYTGTSSCPSSCTLSVTSNEGDADQEAIVIDAHHVQLAAERDGNGGGRTYTITITCTNDTNKESSTQRVTVLVPHDQGNHGDNGDQGDEGDQRDGGDNQGNGRGEGHGRDHQDSGDN